MYKNAQLGYFTFLLCFDFSQEMHVSVNSFDNMLANIPMKDHQKVYDLMTEIFKKYHVMDNVLNGKISDPYRNSYGTDSLSNLVAAIQQHYAIIHTLVKNLVP